MVDAVIFEVFGITWIAPHTDFVKGNLKNSVFNKRIVPTIIREEIAHYVQDSVDELTTGVD
jgi:hypothetical protein